MGLFSKTKVQVFARSMVLVTEDPFPKKDAVMYAILEGLPIADTLLASMNGGTKQKIPHMRQYAEDTYELGLPNSAINNINNLSVTDLQALVNTEFSLTHGSIVAQHFIADLDASLIILPFLVSQRAFNLTTNVVGTPPAAMTFPETWITKPTIRTCTLKDVVINDTMTSIDITYEANCQYYYLKRMSREVEESQWVYRDVPSARYVTEYTETVPIAAGYVIDAPYYVIGYYKLDSGGEIDGVMDWWFYALDSGKYPTMDSTKQIVEVSSAYPVVPVRHENAWISDTAPDVYSTGKKLLSIINFSYDQLQTGLADNPDLDEIDNAYVMFGIDMQTEDPILISYLIDFFELLGQTSQASVWDQLTSFNSAGTVLETSSYTLNDITGTGYTENSYIADVFESIDTTKLSVTNPDEIMSLKENGLKVKLAWDRIITVVLAGSIGEIGTCTKEYVNHRLTFTGEGGKEGLREKTETVPYQIILRRQTSAGAYKQIIITNLRHHIYGIYQNRYIVTTEIDDLIADADEHNMVIPLHHPTMLRVPNIEVNYVYNHAIHLIITGYVVTHLRWYQQAWVSFVIMVVCLVLAVYTAGQSMSAMAAWMAGIAAASAAGTMALILYVLTPLLKMILLAAIAKGLAKLLGPVGAIIFAVIVFIYTGYASTELATALTPMIAKFNAEFLLTFSMKLASEANTGLAEEQEDIQDAIEAETQEQADAWEELEEKREELFPETTSTGSTNLLMGIYNTPTYGKMSDYDDLYSRVHTGNIGTLSLDMIENYVDISLLLPTVG